jgi:DhnA family fructose-bisphosphate aldolase class Ia
MSEIGKARRLSRLFRKNRTLIIPMEMDCPLEGFSKIAHAAVAGGADAIMTTLGQAKRFSEDLMHVPLVLTISYNFSDQSYALESVSMASRLGASAVKIQFFGPMKLMPLVQLQKVEAECQSYGMPLLLEPIPMSAMPDNKGRKLTNPEAVRDAVARAVFVGADVVKTTYTGDAKSFRAVTSGSPIPVIIAGGPRQRSDKETLQLIRGAIDGGASGGAIGRNITTHHDPLKMTKAIVKIIHENASVETALKELT